MNELTLAEAPRAPKQPDTGATKNKFVSVTFRPWNAYDAAINDPDFEGWANTFVISVSEATKLRDALNGLDL